MGQGADETIGGYSSYFQDYWVSLLRQGRVREAWQVCGSPTRPLMVGIRGNVSLQPQRADFSWEMYKIGAYRTWAQARRQARLRQNPWFSEDLTRYFIDEDPSPVEMTLSHALKQSVRLCPRCPCTCGLRIAIPWPIRSKRAFPFLDYRLVSFVSALSRRLEGAWDRGINMCFEKAMRGRIPESVRARVDKMGFSYREQKMVCT
jgi:asparagine synthase (glutamine-hydrolysing)